MSVAANVPTGRPSRLAANLRPLLRERSFLVGSVVLGLLVLVTIFGPLIIHTSPTATNFAVLQAPSSAHPFGTDHYGRDVLIRVIEAIGLDVAIAASVAALATLVGTTIGLVSGYVGGALDLTVMRVVDVMMSIPAFILALITAIVLGNTLRTLVFALAFAYTPVMIRVVRSQALYLRELPMVETSIAIGTPRWRIILSHILPNTYSVLSAQATLLLAWAILDTAAMGFIGVGVHPPTPELGAMITDGTQDIVTGAWWTSAFPGIVVVLLVVSFNMIGDGLRDFLDPRT
jgi:peptide/nickel transport system permease protein